MPKPPDKPITFTRHEDLPDISIVGYRKQLLAGLGMGHRAYDASKNVTALLVGYPGTGKTVYPTVLAKNLPGNFSLLYIKGNSLLRLDDSSEIAKQLNEVDKYMNETPMVIAFDELDLLAFDRAIRPINYAVATGVMMDILDHKPEKTLTLVTANYPHNLDPAVKSRLNYTVFFELPEKGDLGKMLECLEVPDPNVVGNILYEMANKTYGRLVVRSIVRACDEVKERVNDPEEMAKLLFPHASQFDISEIGEYEHSNRGFISRSEPVIDYWMRYAKEKGLEIN